MNRQIAALALTFVAGAASAQAGDPAAGQKTFVRCGICHAVGPGAATKLGPQLNGIMGRVSGTLPGFAYSAPMKAAKIKWDAASLNDYLASPMKKVAGTKMVFAGLPAAKDRADVIAYLASFKADGSRK